MIAHILVIEFTAAFAFHVKLKKKETLKPDVTNDLSLSAAHADINTVRQSTY